MTSLADSFHPYSKATQVAVTPPPPLRDRGKAGYAEARARATDSKGVMRCEDCNRPIPKGKEEAHHLKKRSQIGGNEKENLRILCKEHHDYREAHGGRKKP